MRSPAPSLTVLPCLRPPCALVLAVSGSRRPCSSPLPWPVSARSCPASSVLLQSSRSRALPRLRLEAPASSALAASMLEASEDEYGGVVVDADKLPSDKAAFARSLAASLSYWKSVGKKGVWLKLPVDHSEFVPMAIKEGFKYHHAEEAYMMLTYWIPDEPCLLPANASHQVGVGGFVISDQMEVLVMQEKYCGSSLDDAWKLPTGFILAGMPM